MFFDIFLIILPLFFAIGAGYTISRMFKIDENTLTRILTDFFMPALVFYSLYTSDIVLNTAARIIGAEAFAILLLLLASIIFCRIVKFPVKNFVPSVCFMNSGFIGIPLMALWGGAFAVNIDVIIDQTQTVILFTVGILIVTGKINLSGLREIIKNPLIWAIVAGFSFRYLKVEIPEYIINIFSFSGNGASALAAFTVGASIRIDNFKFNKYLAAGLILRFAGGFLSGLAAAKLFRLTGDSKIIIIVATSLPSAVFTYVLPLRYGEDTSFPGSMVIISTVMSIFIIPAAFALATMFN